MICFKEKINYVPIFSFLGKHEIILPLNCRRQGWGAGVGAGAGCFWLLGAGAA